MKAKLATIRALSNTLRSGEYSHADVMNAALFLIDFANMLTHAVHLSSGGRDPDEKIYTKRDVEFLVTITRSMEAHREATTLPQTTTVPRTLDELCDCGAKDTGAPHAASCPAD